MDGFNHPQSVADAVRTPLFCCKTRSCCPPLVTFTLNLSQIAAKARRIRESETNQGQQTRQIEGGRNRFTPNLSQQRGKRLPISPNLSQLQVRRHGKSSHWKSCGGNSQSTSLNLSQVRALIGQEASPRPSICRRWENKAVSSGCLAFPFPFASPRFVGPKGSFPQFVELRVKNTPNLSLKHP